MSGSSVWPPSILSETILRNTPLGPPIPPAAHPHPLLCQVGPVDSCFQWPVLCSMRGQVRNERQGTNVRKFQRQRSARRWGGLWPDRDRGLSSWGTRRFSDGW